MKCNNKFKNKYNQKEERYMTLKNKLGLSNEIELAKEEEKIFLKVNLDLLQQCIWKRH